MKIIMRYVTIAVWLAAATLPSIKGAFLVLDLAVRIDE
jgi:hypothetical protein